MTSPNVVPPIFPTATIGNTTQDNKDSKDKESGDKEDTASGEQDSEEQASGEKDSHVKDSGDTEVPATKGKYMMHISPFLFCHLLVLVIFIA